MKNNIAPICLVSLNLELHYFFPLILLVSCILLTFRAQEYLLMSANEDCVKSSKKCQKYLCQEPTFWHLYFWHSKYPLPVRNEIRTMFEALLKAIRSLWHLLVNIRIIWHWHSSSFWHWFLGKVTMDVSRWYSVRAGGVMWGWKKIMQPWNDMYRPTDGGCDSRTPTRAVLGEKWTY